MKKNLQSSYLIILGVVILTVFSSVIFVNLNKEDSSESYYGKIGDTREYVESIYIKDNYLHIETTDGVAKFCAKTTQTIPNENNVCWKDIEDNYGSIQVYKNKKY